MALIHASDYDPIIFPWNGDTDPAQIDRAQSIDPSTALNREEVNEIGRNPDNGLVGFVKGSPTVGYSMTQLEYGSIEFWRKITNKADSVNTIDLEDFRTSAFDIAAYLTDLDGAVLGTLVYPGLRTSGFSINIADPDAIIERTFDFVGEEASIWQGNNLYYVYERHTAGSGNDNEIDLSTRVPVADPDIDGGATDEEKFIIRVLRVRGVTVEELEVTTDYTYSDGTKILTIVSIETGDIIKVVYTSLTEPSLLWTPNDSDPVALRADSVDIFLFIPATGSPTSTDKVFRLQTVTLDVTFDRNDLKEIGNPDVVERSINDQTVTVTLGRLLDEFTVEEVLRGEAPGYGHIDVEKFTDNASLIIKFYTDNTKSTFTYGFRADGLSPTDLNNAIAVQEHTNLENVVEGKSVSISNDVGVLGI